MPTPAKQGPPYLMIGLLAVYMIGLITSSVNGWTVATGVFGLLTGVTATLIGYDLINGRRD